MEAIKRGKHVCVQKPLVNRIWEANELHQAAKKKGVKTNMGNQGHTGEQIRQLKEWIQAGVVGNVKEIHVWTNRPIWPQGNDGQGQIQLQACSCAAGRTLNWTLAGADPHVHPYFDGLHPFAWRGISSSVPVPWATWAATSWMVRSGAAIWANPTRWKPKWANSPTRAGPPGRM
jgi:hypothetical protein